MLLMEVHGGFWLLWDMVFLVLLFSLVSKYRQQSSGWLEESSSPFILGWSLPNSFGLIVLEGHCLICWVLLFLFFQFWPPEVSFSTCTRLALPVGWIDAPKAHCVLWVIQFLFDMVDWWVLQTLGSSIQLLFDSCWFSASTWVALSWPMDVQ